MTPSLYIQARVRDTGARVYLQADGTWTPRRSTARRTHPLRFLDFLRIVQDAPAALWDIEARRDTWLTTLFRSL